MFVCAMLDIQTGMTYIKETVAVYEVNKDSLADGILVSGDVLVSVSFDGKTTEILRQHHIIDMMLDVRVGDVVTLNILRNGEQKALNITITEACLTEY